MTKMRTALIALGAGTLAMFSLATYAGDADPSVGRALDSIGQKYEVDKDGDYKLVLGFDDNRTQLLFINSAVETLGDMKIREVWGVAATFPQGSPPKDLAVELMIDSSQKKLGGWQFKKMGDKLALVYVMQVDASLPAAQLKSVFTQCAIIVDEKEKAVTGGKDDY